MSLAVSAAPPSSRCLCCSPSGSPHAEALRACSGLGWRILVLMRSEGCGVCVGAARGCRQRRSLGNRAPPRTDPVRLGPLVCKGCRASHKCLSERS
eukprot:2806242-Rhodomonas_salina.1